MKELSKLFSNQVANVKKRKCSAPAQMFTLIFICLLIVFGFELAGLVNREKNLELRQEIVKNLCKFFS